MARRVLLRLLPLALGAGLTVAVLGVLREDEPTFTAAEFVSRANAEGAGLALGEPLDTFGQDYEVFSVELPEHEEGRARAEAEAGHAHGAAALVVTEDEDAALGEFEACESAISFVCYRAANVVLRVESDDPAALARIEAAFLALGPG